MDEINGIKLEKWEIWIGMWRDSTKKGLGVAEGKREYMEQKILLPEMFWLFIEIREVWLSNQELPAALEARSLALKIVVLSNFIILLMQCQCSSPTLGRNFGPPYFKICISFQLQFFYIFLLFFGFPINKLLQHWSNLFFQKFPLKWWWIRKYKEANQLAPSF